MYSISYNKNSRDDDGNRITLKPFRDMLIEKGILKMIQENIYLNCQILK